MEKRIKALYIITILSILGFLGMQSYWLYTRYEYSLTQYEDMAQKDVSEILAFYRHERIKALDSIGETFLSPTSYSVTRIPRENGKDFKVIRSRTSAPGYAQKILAIKGTRPLTQEEILRVADIINANDSLQESLRIETTLHNPPSESAVLDALKNYDLEMNVPFSTSKIDSLLRQKGYDVEVSSVRTDSVEWEPSLQGHISPFAPAMRFSAPYSEMDRKSVAIVVRIPVSQVIAGMIETFIYVGIVSLLLIICLIYQFSTIVHLDKLDKMRSEFTSTMIHELKRPVSTLKMCVSGLANEKMNADPKIHNHLINQTRKALDLLSAYFSKMRDLTFNKVQQIPLNCEKIPLHSLLDETEGRIVKPNNKNVEWINCIPSELEIYADHTHLMNIFTNLIENAVKYSGESVTIKAKSKVLDSGSICISIIDNGYGIATSDIRKIFSLFYRGKAVDIGLPGMGLGLAYVKMLVEAHGGKISVVSLTDGPDRGSCFTIELPQ